MQHGTVMADITVHQAARILTGRLIESR